MAKHNGDASMSSAFIYSDDFRGYSFSPDHPFNQLRVTLTYDLLQKSGFISLLKSSRQEWLRMRKLHSFIQRST